MPRKPEAVQWEIPSEPRKRPHSVIFPFKEGELLRKGTAEESSVVQGWGQEDLIPFQSEEESMRCPRRSYWTNCPITSSNVRY